jgi:hypothetical protein
MVIPPVEIRVKYNYINKFVSLINKESGVC